MERERGIHFPRRFCKGLTNMTSIIIYYLPFIELCVVLAVFYILIVWMSCMKVPLGNSPAPKMESASSARPSVNAAAGPLRRNWAQFAVRRGEQSGRECGSCKPPSCLPSSLYDILIESNSTQERMDCAHLCILAGRINSPLTLLIIICICQLVLFYRAKLFLHL